MSDPMVKAAIDALSKEAAKRFFPLIDGRSEADPYVNYLGLVVAITIQEAYRQGREDERNAVSEP